MENNSRSRCILLSLGMTLALFAVQAAMMGGGLAHLSGVGETLALSALFALVYGGAMVTFVHLERPKMGTLAFVGAFAALSMLARVNMLDFVTADYNSFLKGWLDIFREGGFAMLAQNVGDYNLIYQYILLLITKIPLHDLYLIKLVTVAFDYALALVMMRTAGRFGGERAKLPVLGLMLIYPTVLIDGACWGQCDSVYVFFIVLSLYLLATDRPMRSAAALAVAFAFKLQTIFFFPVVLLGLLHKKYRLRDALVFLAAYVVTMIPALLAGKPFMEALMVYANQSMGQYYDRLTYGAPNLYMLFPMMDFSTGQPFKWMRYIPGLDALGVNPYLNPDIYPDLQHAALYACVILVLLAVIYWMAHWREITPEMMLDFAFFCAIFLPFVMPKMHERYFFLADVLAVLYAVRHERRRYMPLLVAGASLTSYASYLMRQVPVDQRISALMMLAALVVVGHDLLARMRQNRAVLAKGGEAA